MWHEGSQELSLCGKEWPQIPSRTLTTLQVVLMILSLPSPKQVAQPDHTAQ